MQSHQWSYCPDEVIHNSHFIFQELDLNPSLIRALGELNTLYDCVCVFYLEWYIRKCHFGPKGRVCITIVSGDVTEGLIQATILKVTVNVSHFYACVCHQQKRTHEALLNQF